MIFEKQVLDIYKKTFTCRCDADGSVFYFSHSDFDGLAAEPYCFTSSRDHELRGYFYSYEPVIEGRLVIFDHGFGGGHRAYMREIELLCRHGYLVFSYDHTGCMESGGDGTVGLSQSLADLDDCIKALKADEKYKGMTFSVIGHSWGGFSTLNISALHPEITHCVVFSGFSSVKRMVNSFFSGLLSPYRKAVFDYECSVNPRYCEIDGLNTVASAKANMLLVYSANDPMVKKKVHFDALVKAAEANENVGFILEVGKGHNPNYTEDAVKYLGEFTGELKKRKKKGLIESEAAKAEFIASFDWMRMTCQDDEVWDDVFAFLATEIFH